MTSRRLSGDDVVWMSELDVPMCWALLRRERLGRIAYVRDAEPAMLPVNHLVDGNTIVFRTDHESSLGALSRGAAVVFEVDGSDATVQTGWSVIVHGHVVTVDDPAERQRLTADGLQAWAPGPKDCHLRLAAVSVTGRAISRRRRQADGSFMPYMPAD